MPVMPQLDHMIGLKVERIERQADQESDAHWQMVFENGAIVANHDPARDDPPDEILEMGLTMVTMGELETEMIFSKSGEGEDVRVQLTPAKYTISTAQTEQPYYPQVPEEFQTPEEPTERIIDETEWLEKQQATPEQVEQQQAEATDDAQTQEKPSEELEVDADELLRRAAEGAQEPQEGTQAPRGEET
jgi:hypothetical protein